MKEYVSIMLSFYLNMYVYTIYINVCIYILYIFDSKLMMEILFTCYHEYLYLIPEWNGHSQSTIVVKNSVCAMNIQ